LFGISERRACTIFCVDRTSVRYARPRSDDSDLRSRLREIAAERRRFGYGRLGIMLDREGLVMKSQEADAAVPRGEPAGQAPAWP
jgi:putative transposase